VLEVQALSASPSSCDLVLFVSAFPSPFGATIAPRAS